MMPPDPNPYRQQQRTHHRTNKTPHTAATAACALSDLTTARLPKPVSPLIKIQLAVREAG
jgi:hypothetical protein